MFIVKILVKFFVEHFSSAMIVLFGLASAGLLVLIFCDEGWRGVWKTIAVDTFAVAKAFFLLLAIFFSITGSLNHLEERRPEKFKAILSGKWGQVPMMGLAALMPGMAGTKQIGKAYKDKSIEKINVLLCLTASMALGIHVFIYRAKFLGGELTLIWVGMSFWLLAQVWFVCKFKPWRWFGFG